MNPDSTQGESSDLTTASIPYAEGSLPLENVNCYLCGRDDGALLVDDPPFRVIECSCGLAYATPRVPDSHVHLIYQTDYFKSRSAADYGYTNYTRDRKGYLRTFRGKADLVSSYRSGGKVLEVGSAAGYFLHVMEEKGFETQGVEVSRYVSDFARNELGLKNVFTGRLEEAGLEPNQFDIVALWDVIEHLGDPIQDLIRIRDLMRQDGFLFIQTQDVDTRFRRLLGSRWQHFKQLEHLHHFSPQTIQVLLEKAGFETVNISHKGAGKYISLEFFIERMKRYSVLLHHLLWPARIFGRFFFYLNPRDEMIVVARPRGADGTP